jgi:hypothetical protein
VRRLHVGCITVRIGLMGVRTLAARESVAKRLPDLVKSGLSDVILRRLPNLNARRSAALFPRKPGSMSRSTSCSHNAPLLTLLLSPRRLTLLLGLRLLPLQLSTHHGNRRVPSDCRLLGVRRTGSGEMNVGGVRIGGICAEDERRRVGRGRARRVGGLQRGALSGRYVRRAERRNARGLSADGKRGVSARSL